MHGMIGRKHDDIFEIAKHLGDIVAQSRNAKAALAIAAAKSALANKIDEDDVNEIFELYIRHSMEIDHVDRTDNSFKANASKLRTIVRCALDNKDILQTLERVSNRYDRLNTKTSLFEVMVAVCRVLADKGKLTSEDLDKAVMLSG